MPKTVEELEAELAAMRTKQEELLNETKAAKKAAATAAEAEAKAKKEKEDAEAAAETERAKKAGDFAALEAQLKKKHDADLKERDDKIAALEAARDTLVLDGGLSEAVASIGVAEPLRPAVQALLKARGATVKLEGGEFVAYLGDKKLADAMKAFAESDEGKHFITNNNNGGHNGGRPGGGETGANPYKKETWNRTLQGKLERDDKAKANKYRADAGLPAIA
jgi:hypothetical protein